MLGLPPRVVVIDPGREGPRSGRIPGGAFARLRATMTWDRLRQLGYLLAFVLLGVIIFSLYGAFKPELEKSQYIGFLGGVLLGAFLVSLLLIVMIVPDRRRTGWVKAITNVNAKWLFFVLILAWAGTMGFLASLDLPGATMGAPALVGLFAGVFIFMGFIWSVIGE